jgi:hypothetical protein
MRFTEKELSEIMVKRARPKYGNKKTSFDGKEFDSAKEAKRYNQLQFCCGLER